MQQERLAPSAPALKCTNHDQLSQAMSSPVATDGTGGMADQSTSSRDSSFIVYNTLPIATPTSLSTRISFPEVSESTISQKDTSALTFFKPFASSHPQSLNTIRCQLWQSFLMSRVCTQPCRCQAIRHVRVTILSDLFDMFEIILIEYFSMATAYMKYGYGMCVCFVLRPLTFRQSAVSRIHFVSRPLFLPTEFILAIEKDLAALALSSSSHGFPERNNAQM